MNSSLSLVVKQQSGKKLEVEENTGQFHYDFGSTNVFTKLAVDSMELQIDAAVFVCNEEGDFLKSVEWNLYKRP